ncbi:MAG: transposase [Pyrinomonadaceae bacterium]
MFRVSKDTPAYYLTSVTKDRLPIFRTSTLARITCEAINEARKSAGFLIFAYVIMLDHLHLVTDNSRSSRDTLRFVNGIISRRVIDHLKTGEHFESLKKLRIQERSENYKYSLWQHHPDTRLLWSEEMLSQRINYTHLNPVRAGLAEHPDNWTWSSSRIWHKRRAEVEPLDVDIEQLLWH